MNLKIIKILLIPLSLFLIFFNFNTQKVYFTDELLFEEAGYNMAFDTNRTLVNRIMVQYLGTEPWLEKPPLYFWATAIVFKAVNILIPLSPLREALIPGGIFIYPFIRRLPTNLAALIVLYFSFQISRNLVSKKLKDQAGILTVLLLLSSPLFMHPSREASLDLFSSMFSIIATYFYFKLLNKNLSQKMQFKYLVLTGFLFGLSFMTRSFLSLTPLAVIFILHYFYLKNFKKYFYHMLILSTAFLLTALPWHLYMYATFGKDFVDTYYIFNVVNHSAELLEGYDATHWWYYLQSFSGTVPWLFPSMIIFIFSRKNIKISLQQIYLISVFVITIFILSCSFTRHDWYAISLVPFIAISFSQLLINSFKKIKLNLLKRDLLFGFLVAFFVVFFAEPVIRKTGQVHPINAATWVRDNYSQQQILYTYKLSYVTAKHLFHPVDAQIADDKDLESLLPQSLLYVDNNTKNSFQKNNNLFKSLEDFDGGAIYERL